MDISSQGTAQVTNDDNELAKALAGITQNEAEETVVATAPELPGALVQDEPIAPIQPQAPVAPITPTQPQTQIIVSSDLDNIKRTALDELRPLVDKVSLPAEEKFDIYIMLIRSTDDTSLIGPAHLAAQGIQDEKKRAEALLEIIKEIDYLSRKEQK